MRVREIRPRLFPIQCTVEQQKCGAKPGTNLCIPILGEMSCTHRLTDLPPITTPLRPDDEENNLLEFPHSPRRPREHLFICCPPSWQRNETCRDTNSDDLKRNSWEMNTCSCLIRPRSFSNLVWNYEKRKGDKSKKKAQRHIQNAT